jgi:hypothetical protein
MRAVGTARWVSIISLALLLHNSVAFGVASQQIRDAPGVILLGMLRYDVIDALHILKLRHEIIA